MELTVFCASVNPKCRDLEPRKGFAANHGQDFISKVQVGPALNILTFDPTHQTDYIAQIAQMYREESLYTITTTQNTLNRHELHSY